MKKNLVSLMRDQTLPDFTRNLRYQLWQRKVAREHWAFQLMEWLACSECRAWELLHGIPPNQEELLKLSEWTEQTEEQLQSVNLDGQSAVLAENLRYLLEAPKRGGKKALAAELGVKQGTLSCWLRGRRPECRHQEAIKRYFGLPATVDLETVPLFLELSPVGSLEQREWLRQRISELDEATLRVLFPALEKLLR